MIIVNKDIGLELHPLILRSFRHRRMYLALIEDILRTAVNYTYVGTNPRKLQYERSDNSQIIIDSLNLSDGDIDLINATETLILRKVKLTQKVAEWYTITDISSSNRSWILTYGGDHRILEWEAGRGKPKDTSNDNK